MFKEVCAVEELVSTWTVNNYDFKTMFIFYIHQCHTLGNLKCHNSNIDSYLSSFFIYPGMSINM